MSNYSRIGAGNPVAPLTSPLPAAPPAAELRYDGIASQLEQVLIDAGNFESRLFTVGMRLGAQILSDAKAAADAPAPSSVAGVLEGLLRQIQTRNQSIYNIIGSLEAL
jgi:hypothetical protein